MKLVWLLAASLAACSPVSGHEPVVVRRGGRLVAGSLVEVRLDDSISLRHNKPGDALRGAVTDNVVGPRGAVVIPQGSTVKLRITELGPHRIILWATELTFENRRYVVHGRVDAPPAVVRRQHAGRDMVVPRGTRMVFPLDRALTVATR